MNKPTTGMKYSERSGWVVLRSGNREVKISVEELTGRVGVENALAVVTRPNTWLPCELPLLLS